jgi:hypothetical protein
MYISNNSRGTLTLTKRRNYGKLVMHICMAIRKMCSIHYYYYEDCNIVLRVAVRCAKLVLWIVATS